MAVRDESSVHPAFRTTTALTTATSDEEPSVVTDGGAGAQRKSLHLQAFPATSLSPARMKHLQDPVCRAEIKNGKTRIIVNMDDLLSEVQDLDATDYDDLYIYAIHRREEIEDGADTDTKSYEWKRLRGTYSLEANANAAAEQELYASELAIRFPGQIADNDFEIEHGVKENGLMAYRIVIPGAGTVEVMVHKMRTRA